MKNHTVRRHEMQPTSAACEPSSIKPFSPEFNFIAAFRPNRFITEDEIRRPPAVYGTAPDVCCWFASNYNNMYTAARLSDKIFMRLNVHTLIPSVVTPSLVNRITVARTCIRIRGRVNLKKGSTTFSFRNVFARRPSVRVEITSAIKRRIFFPRLLFSRSRSTIPRRPRGVRATAIRSTKRSRSYQTARVPLTIIGRVCTTIASSSLFPAGTRVFRRFNAFSVASIYIRSVVPCRIVGHEANAIMAHN